MIYRPLAFKKQPACPLTNEPTPNYVLALKGMRIHLSYNPSSAGYGCDTTAIVLDERVFFVLNGNHEKPLIEAASSGMQAIIDYFIAHIDQANGASEHKMTVGLQNDQFSLEPTALEVIGQDNLDRIREAATACTEGA